MESSLITGLRCGEQSHEEREHPLKDHRGKGLAICQSGESRN